MIPLIPKVVALEWSRGASFFDSLYCKLTGCTISGDLTVSGAITNAIIDANATDLYSLIYNSFFNSTDLEALKADAILNETERLIDNTSIDARISAIDTFNDEPINLSILDALETVRSNESERLIDNISTNLRIDAVGTFNDGSINESIDNLAASVTNNETERLIDNISINTRLVIVEDNNGSLTDLWLINYTINTFNNWNNIWTSTYNKTYDDNNNSFLNYFPFGGAVSELNNDLNWVDSIATNLSLSNLADSIRANESERGIDNVSIDARISAIDAFDDVSVNLSIENLATSVIANETQRLENNATLAIFSYNQTQPAMDYADGILGGEELPPDIAYLNESNQNFTQKVTFGMDVWIEQNLNVTGIIYGIINSIEISINSLLERMDADAIKNSTKQERIDADNILNSSKQERIDADNILNSSKQERIDADNILNSTALENLNITHYDDNETIWTTIATFFGFGGDVSELNNDLNWVDSISINQSHADDNTTLTNDIIEAGRTKDLTNYATSNESYTQTGNVTFGDGIIFDSTNQIGRCMWNGSCTICYGTNGVMEIC